MINHNSLCIRKLRVGRSGVWLAAGLLLVLAAAIYLAHTSAAARVERRSLTFEDRVAAQRAIEEVYWRHRIWPRENPQPKPALDQVMPEAVIRAKVEDYLRKSQALEVYWQRPITAEQLQAEMERMAQQTKQPEALGELWAALGNDPLLIAECLARPLLADRLLRERYAADERFHSEIKSQQMTFDEWWNRVKAEMAIEAAAASDEYRLPEIAAQPGACLTESWAPVTQTGATGANYPVAVWTGSEMLFWGDQQLGGRYNPATDSWMAITRTGAPSDRRSHTVVWTGIEMIVWGGRVGNFDVFNSGGRYNPMTNNWTATSTTGAPTGRDAHTAIWTGSEMIVWGGADSNFNRLNSGGRYNPSNNSWMPTATTGAPSARSAHTAVWTGSEIIVWGGFDSTGGSNSGGRYNPSTDNWRAIATTGAPSGRGDHKAVWTGSVMIVWGGKERNELNSGGLYNPANDNWTATTATGAPHARTEHTAVWTGSEMIVWGGCYIDGFLVVLGGGGRYNPATNTWVTTSTTNAPSPRCQHSAVWTGNEMIVWAGVYNNAFRTGGIYTPHGAPPIAPIKQTFGSNGGTGSINVLAPSGCNWTATTQANWLTITSGANGSGNGMVNYSVATNPNTISRTGTINVVGRTFTVTQAGCTVSISPAGQVFAAAGGSGRIDVVSSGVCNWTATSDADWITISSGASGSSSGTVSFTVSPNQTGSSRSGTLTVANQSFKVTQVPYANDVGAAGFELPSGAAIGKPLTIRVRVTNFGAAAQSNIPISYRINDGAPITENLIGPIAPLQTLTKTFSAAWTPSVSGNYQITARTNLGGDENAANDAAQVTIPAAQPQYLGNWQGTTGQGLPVRFTVDERDVVASLEMDIRISIPSTGTCTYTFRASREEPIANGQFSVPMGAGGIGVFSNAIPNARGTFSSPTACAGSVSDFGVGLAICGENVYFGSFSVSGPSFSAQRQSQAVCPAVRGLTPTSGAVGSKVTISGASLAGITSVRFGNNVVASFTIDNNTQITATVPGGASNGPVTISKDGCADAQTASFTVLSAPLPVITSLNPTSSPARGAGFVLTVNGSNFVDGSVARWNGSNRTTTYVDSTQLVTLITATDLATAGAASVTVFNPALGGGASNAVNFTIAVANAVTSVSAASFLGAELAAESIVAAFGQNLATNTQVATALPLPTELAGTTVRVRDSAGVERLAGLFFVAPAQVNYQIPPGTAPGAATVTITSGAGAASAGTVNIASVAPGLFSANANGQGVAAAVVFRRRADGSESFEPVAQFDQAQNRFVPAPIDLGPATDQVFLIPFGTGLRFHSGLSAVTCSIGGANMEVLFAGATPGFVGLDQVNVRLSRSLAGRGEVDVVMTADGKTANTVRIAIK